MSQRHLPGIEATLALGLSNARVEAVDTRIRLLSRIAFGFHSAKALIALALLGVCVTAIAVPLNPVSRGEEFRAHFEAVRAGFLIVLAGSSLVARTVAAEMGIKVLELSGPRGLTLSGAPDGDVPAVDRGGETTRPEPDDIAAILMTSGSTGRAKKVPLTHRNLCVSASHTCRSMALGPADRCLRMWEQFHISGLTSLLMTPLASGGAVIYTTGFDPAEFYRLVETRKPTWFMGVPTALHELVFHAAKNPVTTRPTSLRLIRSGAAALAPQLMAELETLFGVPVIQSFGMTEAAPLITATLLPPAVRKPGSVGHSPAARSSASSAPAERRWESAKLANRHCAATTSSRATRTTTRPSPIRSVTAGS